MKTKERWILSKNEGNRFPFQISIIKNKQILLSLLVQDKWPGTKGNIFCYRPEETKMPDQKDIVENFGILTYNQYGKRLNVVLDRPQKKRCSFLFLKKKYKNKPGEYEQIFWQTRSGLTQRGPGYKLSYYNQRSYCVYVDSSERYAWNFPGLQSSTEKLPVGDYAIKDDHGLLAVIERKTFDNLVHEFGNLKKFHQILYELEAYRYSALVLEATYEDFLKADKLKYYQPSFAKKAIAEIQALHPSLPVIFAGGRKYAIEWTRNFFTSTIGSKKRSQQLPDKVAESIAHYGKTKSLTGGVETELKRFILSQDRTKFKIQTIRDNFSELTDSTIRRVLHKLRDENMIELHGSGKAAYWTCTNQSD